jgi:hypothetical protein
MAKWEKGGPTPNPKGRGKGNTGKVPSQKDIEDAVLKQSMPTLKKLVELRESDKTSETGMISVCKALQAWTQHILAERKKDKDNKNKDKQPNVTETQGNVTPLFSRTAIEK